MQSLHAPASSYLLSQTSSDIQFGDMNPALLCKRIAGCWLRNEYSVWLTELERVVKHWNAIQFHLVYGSTIYRPVYCYISNSDEIRTHKWSLPKRLLPFSLRHGKIMTTQWSQHLPILIFVGKFMHPVYLIFQIVLLEFSRNWTEM